MDYEETPRRDIPPNPNLFKSYEIAERFNIPKPTAANWSKGYGTWRHKLYQYLEQQYLKEIASKAKEME